MDYCTVKLAPKAAMLTVLFHAISDEEKPCLELQYTPRTMVGTFFVKGFTVRGSSNSGTKQEEQNVCTHVVEARHLGISHYCTRSRRAVKNNNTLPESNTRKRIARITMRKIFRYANHSRIAFDLSM